MPFLKVDPEEYKEMMEEKKKLSQAIGSTATTAPRNKRE